MSEEIKKLIKREKLLVVTNLMVMTFTFFLLGGFLELVGISHAAIKRLESQAQVTAFFKDGVPEENILAIKQEFDKDERVVSVKYVSKEEAFKIFTELNKDDPILLESISANILPASLELRAKNIYNLSSFVQEFNEIDGVEEVRYFEEVMQRFRFWRNVAYTVGAVLVGLFLVISITVVIVTLRISIAGKGKELEVLKLVGASDEYVKKPLIIQGVFFGLSSSVLASVLLVAVGLILDLAYSLSVPGVFPSYAVFSIVISIFSIVAGVGLGYYGSLVAIKRYLKY